VGAEVEADEKGCRKGNCKGSLKEVGGEVVVGFFENERKQKLRNPSVEEHFFFFSWKQAC
jgi:hypothetical protein